MIKYIIIMLGENTAVYMIVVSAVGVVALITPDDDDNDDDRKDAITRSMPQGGG